MKYTIKRGDNLWTLAKRAGVPLSDLLAQVPESVRRDPRKLQPGMTLNIGPESIMYGPRQPTTTSRARHVMSAPRPSAMTDQQANDMYQQQLANTRAGMGAALAAPVAGALPVSRVGQGLGAVYRGYRNMMDDAAQADRDMARYAEYNERADMADARQMVQNTASDYNPVIRGQMMSRQPSSISPNVERMYADHYRGTNAGWNNNPLGGAGSGGEATLFRPHPSRMGTSIGPHPDRGMVAAPARDINRAIEANPNMTLEELAGWLRNNPKQMTPLERDIESMQPSDFTSWLQNRYNPR